MISSYKNAFIGFTLSKIKYEDVRNMLKKTERAIYKLDEVLEKPPLEYVNKHPTGKVTIDFSKQKGDKK